MPSLVPALFQLTGDPRWLSRPVPADPQPRHGQQRLRRLLHRGGRRDPRRSPRGGTRTRGRRSPPRYPPRAATSWPSCSPWRTARPAPPEYAEMLAEDLGFARAPTPSRPRAPTSTRSSSAQGCPGSSPRSSCARPGSSTCVLEKNSEVGGGWWENTYPGRGGRHPQLPLLLLVRPRHDWSTHFGKRDEVEQYLRDVADRFDVRRSIRFDTEVSSARLRRGHRLVDRAHHDGRRPQGARRHQRGGRPQPAEGPVDPGLWTPSPGRSSTRREWPDGVDLTGQAGRRRRRRRQRDAGRTGDRRVRRPSDGLPAFARSGSPRTTCTSPRSATTSTC